VRDNIDFSNSLLGDAILKKSDIEVKSSSFFNAGSFFLILLVVVFALLVTKIAELEIIKGDYYFALSAENRIRRIPIRAPRGVIYDTNGKVLAEDAPVYKYVEFSNSSPISYRILGDEEGKKLFEEGAEGVIVDSKRIYQLQDKTAHLVGFLSEATKDEIGQTICPGKPGYILGDFIGRSGVEEQYDCILRGVNGEELFEVDTSGHKVRVLGRKDSLPGNDIKLSIDLSLQEVAFEAMKGKKGAVVVTKAGSGEILALVSSPSFNPQNIYSDYPLLEKDPNLPLVNRAIGGAYPPGSTFKIISAAAALQEGKIDEKYVYVDPGVIKVNKFGYTNWYYSQYGRTEGPEDLVKAIKRSTDTFFYKLGEMVGAQDLADWAGKFSLGKNTGVDLPGEITGLIPDPKWKQEVIGEPWFLGNTYHMAIGQGYVKLTPLQVNVMTNVIASSGRLCKPSVLKGGSECRDIGLSEKTVNLITQGMVEACKPGGTAFPFFDFHPDVACKTGTAEFEENNQGKTRTHAWFTSFAPSDSPDIVVTVLVEGGGEGSYVAAPIAKEIFKARFSKN